MSLCVADAKFLRHFGKDFSSFSWERTHLACSGNNRETVSTLEACAPRDDLCVPAVRFGVQALDRYLRPNENFVLV